MWVWPNIIKTGWGHGLSHLYLFCHAMCYSRPFGLLVRTRSRPYGLCHFPCTIAHIKKGLDHSYLHVYTRLLLCFLLVLASLVLGFAILVPSAGLILFGYIRHPWAPFLGVTIWDASLWCWFLHAYLSFFPLYAMLCLPCLFVPPVGFLRIFTRFCLLSCLFSFSLVCLLSCFFTCHVYHVYLLYASFICTLNLFLPLLVCWFLAFAFACTHIEQGHIELGHGLPSASKKGEDASM